MLILHIRFKKEHLLELATSLAFPAVIITPNQHHATALDALCMFLQRYCYPNHLADCVQLFGCPPCEISRFANTILDHIYDNFQHLLNIFNHLQLTPEVLERFAQVVTEKGSTLPDTWGFLDGTVCPIAQPIRNQHHVYNRHKCVHALKFQGLMVPNGVIVHLARPWVGRRHDS